jgi:hypothetical protein
MQPITPVFNRSKDIRFCYPINIGARQIPENAPTPRNTNDSILVIHASVFGFYKVASLLLRDK